MSAHAVLKKSGLLYAGEPDFFEIAVDTLRFLL